MMKLFLLFCFFINFINSSILNLEHLYNGIWLSGASYCSKENYENMNIAGPLKNEFEYINTLYDSKTDLQGYIGILSKKKTIYIVLRGSYSVLNWIDDFEIELVPYITYPECECYVHKGFYHSVLGIRNKTIDTIKILKKFYPNYYVVLTGHSYGASSAQLLSMEIEKEGIKTKVYNYGQPRVGDKKYSYFVNTILTEYWRVTHNKDIVPHIPPIKLNYLHSCRELFEDENGNLIQCSEENCEDSLCANKYNLYQTNKDDHMYYLQHELSCNKSIV